jgi:hypothetical protein
MAEKTAKLVAKHLERCGKAETAPTSLLRPPSQTVGSLAWKYDGSRGQRRSGSLEISHDGRSILPAYQEALPLLAEGQSALL